jgi:hypothetical protein
LDSAKLGHTEKVDGFRRLENFVCGVEEKYEPSAQFAKVVAQERCISASLDGRSVFDDFKKQARQSKRQLELFENQPG